jgi:hypothetical protein
MEYDLAELGLNFKINVDTTNANIDSIPKTFSAGQDKNPKIIDVFGDKKTYRINKIHFLINYEIASGNYGKIYAATRITNERCVMKKQRYYGDSELVSILKEIIIQFILNKLNPDIFPKVYGIAWDKSYSYILMERVINGNTVGNEYRNEQEEDQYMFDLCKIIKRLANILEPLQETIKFTHGDLNTGNIFIMKNGDIKLIDFGFSSINLGKEAIITNTDYNTHYNKGKDITIFTYCTTFFLEPDTEYYIHVEPKFILLNLKKIADDKYLSYVNDNIGEIYTELDNDDNLNGHPKKVLEILSDCKTLYVKPSSSSRSGSSGGRQMHIRSSARYTSKKSAKSTKVRSSTKKVNRKLSSGKTMIESLKENYNPENEIHKNNLTVKALTSLLENSYVNHIKKNAKKIANLYKNEVEKSLSLDLFKIMLFYKNNNFDKFISEYEKKTNLLEKQMYLYGTDPSLRGDNFMYVHWDTIPNIFNKDLD